MTTKNKKAQQENQVQPETIKFKKMKMKTMKTIIRNTMKSKFKIMMKITFLKEMSSKDLMIIQILT